MNEQERIQYLFQRCYEQTATTAERAEFLSLVSQTQHEEEVNKLIEETYSLQPVDRPDEQTSRSILAAILDTQKAATVAVHRIHFLKTTWFRYAAAIIILFGIGSYLYLYISNQKEKPSVTQTNPNPVLNDVAPGGNKAILTLADGSKIVLDSAKSGQLAREANATITKSADGKIVYDADEKLGDGLLFNTLATPRGGQYQLTLPDGSQVWLNAESSITYPTAFTEKERIVSIAGEAYFEVAKDSRKPFKVVIGNATIEVLGTHFNVNTYKEELTKNITLLEGSVRLTNSVHTSLVLKPGQQGQLKDHQLSLAANPDVEQVMAWKNGIFQFERTPIKNALRQFERWYNVEVVYAKEPPSTLVSGKMQRSLNLSQVLSILKGLEIQYRIEGKKLIIL
jgi:transmembrane sensor